MIQIDGLSLHEFQQALKQGQMPFAQRLIEQEHYRLNRQYSGLPASTPAVQAELFYGIKTAVPAFTFKDCARGKIIRMFEPDAAAAIEKTLTGQAVELLLEGGSAYADNFTGGAQEAHFCPASLGWGSSLRNARPLVFCLLLVSHLYSFLRTGILLLVELVLALIDCTRGLSRGYTFVKELAFIPTRVAISILLRELVVIGAKIDMARGLPVIHLNFLGYDEQAHRRGPDSQFAHWTLQGIDDAIKRLWRTSKRSQWRQYDVWIYSDHGQIKVSAYHQHTGQTVDQAVETVFNQLAAGRKPGPPSPPESIQTQRVNLLGGRFFQRLFARVHLKPDGSEAKRAEVAALGPVGFVYPKVRLTPTERAEIARELTQQHDIPAIVFRQGKKQLCARTAERTIQIPQQKELLFGSDHPFLAEISQDLVALCDHPGAGELTLLGWCAGREALSFAVENGAHAGISREETEAFSLLPADTAGLPGGKSYLRPVDLRHAALRHRERRRDISAQ